MKKHTRNTEVQTNEKEIGKQLGKEFRIMIVKMIKNLENKMEKTQDSINKDPEGEGDNEDEMVGCHHQLNRHEFE